MKAEVTYPVVAGLSTLAELERGAAVIARVLANGVATDVAETSIGVETDVVIVFLVELFNQLIDVVKKGRGVRRLAGQLMIVASDDATSGRQSVRSTLSGEEGLDCILSVHLGDDGQEHGGGDEHHRDEDVEVDV